MFFRFVAALVLVVLISITGVSLEKQTLEMKRVVSRQHFQMDLLLEMHARLRLSIQRRTAPAQLQNPAGSFAGDNSALFFVNPRPADDATARQGDGDGRRHSSGPESSTLENDRVESPSSESPVSPLPLLRWERPAPLIRR